MKRVGIPGPVAVLLLSVAAPVVGQTYPEFSLEEEIRLAMSAGPPTVSSDADIYVLGEAGFEKAVSGSNGWACLVVRSAADARTLAPHCLNPYAERTVLRAFLLEGELQRQGLSQEAISSELTRRFENGDLPLPEGPAYAYMLSKGQRIGPQAGAFKPHFMLYVPYVTNAAIGGDPGNQAFPFVGPYEDHPLATVVIIMDEFVDPAEMTVPGS